MSFVEVTVIGYVAKPPEVKFTSAGTKVMEFSIAHKNRKEETEWYNCSLWGDKRIDSLDWLEKGMGVFVRGELSLTAKDEKIYRNVNVRELQVISGGKKAETTDEEYF